MARSPKPETELSFVGSYLLPYREKPGVRAAFSWPFARVRIGRDRLSLAVRQPLRFVMPSAEIKYAEIVDARALRGRIFSVIELSSTRPDVDGAIFGTMNRHFDIVLKALNDRGLTVA